MDKKADLKQMLELLLHPAFCVKNNLITELNEAAQRIFLQEGTPIDTLLNTGAEEYASYQEGVLCVTLRIHDQVIGASVSKIQDYDIFTLDQQDSGEELRILALAARELRGPLSTAMLAAQSITADGNPPAQASSLNRGLHQLLRIITNMSDAAQLSPGYHPELSSIRHLFGEMVEKITAAAEFSGVTVESETISDDLLCYVDPSLLERAILNMVSNALKFTPRGGKLSISLSRRGQMLRISVTDSGSAIDEKILPTVFHRYLREPVIEDSRHGIGLGMLLIRNVAAAHGGAVLVDQTEGSGARVSMTIRINDTVPNLLRSSRLYPDYAGELDHILLELSDVLPSKLY